MRGLHLLLKGKSPDVAEDVASWFKTAVAAALAGRHPRLCGKSFPDADQVGEALVFNIRGNRIRLIATVFYPGADDLSEGSAHAPRIRPGGMEKMGVTTLNQPSTGALRDVLPKVIETDEEFDRLVEVMESLDRKPDATAEEAATAGSSRKS